MTTDRPAHETEREIEVTPEMVREAKAVLQSYFFEPVFESEVSPYEVLRDLLYATGLAEKVSLVVP